MIKTTLILFLLGLTVNGDVLTKETVEDYLNKMERTFYTVEKTCWTDEDEKAADMVAREVKKQFPQIKSALLRQEGDLALPVYKVMRDLCETAKNITKEAIFKWSDDEHCFISTDNKPKNFYGLTSEETQEWLEIIARQSEAMTALVKPVFEASIVAKVATVNWTKKHQQRCEHTILKDFLEQESDEIVSKYNDFLEGFSKTNITSDNLSPTEFAQDKAVLRLRMTSLAGQPCGLVKYIDRKMKNLEGVIDFCLKTLK